MKYNNPMTYILGPLLIIEVAVVSYLHFAMNLFSGTPVYDILLVLSALLFVLLLTGEKITARRTDARTGKAVPSMAEFASDMMRGSSVWVVVLSVFIPLAIIGGLVALCIWNVWLGFSLFILLCVGTLVFALVKGPKNAAAFWRNITFVKSYGEEPQPLSPCFCFADDDEADALSDPALLSAALEIISHGAVVLPKTFSQPGGQPNAPLAGYLAGRLDEAGLGAAVSCGTTAADLVRALNKIIVTKHLPVNPLTEDALTAFDAPEVKSRRRDGVSALNNDVNAAYRLLAERGVVLIHLFGDRQCLSIVTKEELSRLLALEKKMEVNAHVKGACP